MKRLFILLTFISLGLQSSAQYSEDALRFSRNYFGGSARMLGLAGAQQALGADISSISGNPAGLGFYRRNDFSISPTLRFSETQSSFYNKTSVDNRDQLNIGNLGFVLTQINQDYSGADVKNGWVSYTFGFGMNRVNNFYENRYFKGLNSQSSISNYFAEIANTRGNDYPDTNLTSIEDMAWYGYMIDFDTTTNKFVEMSNGNVTQSQSDKIEGYQNEWNFSFGANYSNTLYLGASLGIGSVKYNRTSKFTETGINDPTYGLSDITLNEKLNITGSSVHLKVGAILRPADFVRMGVTLQTPDYYSFDEGFITDVSSANTAENDGYSSFTPLEYLFQYKLRTPFKYQGGLAFFFQKFGLISADIEMLDYSNNKLSANAEFSDFGPTQNAVIQNVYQSTYNVRLGAEFKYDNFSFRGGYAQYGDPYKSAVVDGTRTFITGGLGYRFEEYYVDLAFVNQSYNSQYIPYSLNNSDLNPIVENKHNINSVVLTFGTKF